MVQQPIDHLSSSRADFRSAESTSVTVEGHAWHLLGRQMVQRGQSPAWFLGTGMGGHQLIVAGVDLDLPSTAAHPQMLSDQTEGSRVIGPFEDQIAIAVEFDSLPNRHVVRCIRQGLQRRALRHETVQGPLLGCAMGPLPSGGFHPAQHILVSLGDGRGRPAAQEVPFDIVYRGIYSTKLSFFVQAVSCFDGQSTPAPLPTTQTIRHKIREVIVWHSQESRQRKTFPKAQ